MDHDGGEGQEAGEAAEDRFKLHYFDYNILKYSGEEEIGSEIEYEGKAEYANVYPLEYEKFFEKNRVQRKLLPIFRANESKLTYFLKSNWIKIRGLGIKFLSAIHVKSSNRANR